MRTIFPFLLSLWLLACQSGPAPSGSPSGESEDPFLLLNQTTDQFHEPSEDFLVKDEEIRQYYNIDNQGISFYASPEDRAAGKIEARIYKEEYGLTSRFFAAYPLDSIVSWYQKKGLGKWPARLSRTHNRVRFSYRPGAEKPLSGLRVALDPGHLAGDMELAELEGKYVKMKPSADVGSEAINFFEADLTLATAHLIREKLDSLGAKVMMTRSKRGLGIRGISWKDWRKKAFPDTLKLAVQEGRMTKEQAKHWRKKAREDQIMGQFYTADDLRERAKAINDFMPHLTLIIHFNVHGPNWEKRDDDGFFQPTQENYSMAFTPGSFMEGELADVKSRVAFLRLLVSNDLETSSRLCHFFLQKSEEFTGVRPVGDDDDLSYLNRSSMLTGPKGVYARNLTLTRLVAGPVCYGESLCQDHFREAITLNQKDIAVEGIPVSSRLKKVARAYVEAVLEFVKDGKSL
ncbi:MAG: hypothetical protein AAF206_12605 [Bacteroidota bacterium]